MTQRTTISNAYEKQISEKNQLYYSSDIQKILNTTFNFDASNDRKNDGISVDKQITDQDLLSLAICDDTQQTNSINTLTALSDSNLPYPIIDSLNIVTKQLSLLYQSVINITTTEQGEDFIKDAIEVEDQIAASFVRPFFEQETSQFQTSSTVPKITTNTIRSNKQKRYIMMIYNCSSRNICEGIYDRLIKSDYKVWIHLTDTIDDIFVSIARAIQNSYIVLLFINQQYYANHYYRLGSNILIDSSSLKNFDQSFEKLIHQIAYVEKTLSLQSCRIPTPCSMINPMQSTTTSTSDITRSRVTNNICYRRFHDIIHQYKRSINKEQHELNQLTLNETLDLMIKLHRELYTETLPVLSNNERKCQTLCESDLLNQLFDRFLGSKIQIYRSFKKIVYVLAFLGLYIYAY